jgi:hypothetical protein
MRLNSSSTLSSLPKGSLELRARGESFNRRR